MTVEAGELVVRIVANGGNLGRTVQSEVGRATGSVTKLGRSLGLAFGGAAVVKGITTTLNLAKNFDLTMRQVGVQTGLSGDQLDRMRQLALKMGQDTVYSAQDAGDAMLELAKGGLTSAQIEAGALNTAMQLAAAGGIDLSDAASAVVNGMGAFSIKASHAGRVATALAGAANASSADVSDMTQALAQASAAADGAGLSIEETSAALAIFANNGVKGSDAGTSLKTMLQNLQPTTTKQRDLMQQLGLSFVDAHGNFVDLEQIAGRLQKSMGGLTQAQRAQAMRTLFGSDAMRAANFLYKAGADGVAKYTKATSNQETVQKMANTAMEGASGAWENFTGTLETAAIRLGTKALPYLTDLLNWGSDLVNSADEWGPTVVDSFDGVIDAAKSLWPIIEKGAEVVGDLAQFWAGLPGPVKSATWEAGLFALVLPRVAGGLTAVAAQGARATGAINAFARGTETATQRAKLANAALTGAGIAGGLLMVQDHSGKAGKAVGILGGALTGAFVGGTLGSAIPGIGTAIGAVGGAVIGATGATVQMIKASDNAAGSMTAAEDAASDYAAALDATAGKIDLVIRKTILQKLQQDGILQSAMQLGIQQRDLVGAMLGNSAAIKRVNQAYDRQRYMLDALQANKIKDWLYEQGIAFRKARREAIQSADGLTTWKQALRGIPKDVRVKLRAEGFKPTRAEFKALTREAHLTPKQVRIIIKAIGYDPAIQGAKKTGKALDDVGRKRGDLTNWERGLIDGLTGGQQHVRRGVQQMNTDLDSGVRQGATKAGGTASSGGRGVGSALQSGIMFGFSGTAAQLAAAAAAAVRQAIAAAKAAAKVKSPSKVWRDELGKQMPLGGALGINDTAPVMARAARDAVKHANKAAEAELLGSRKLGQFVAKRLVEGLVGSRDEVRRTAQQLADLVGAAFDARDREREKRRNKLESVLHSKKSNDLEKQRAKRELAQIKAAAQRDREREHAIRKLIRDQQQASSKLGREWERNHRKLEDARQAVKDLQQQQAEYAKSVAAAMVEAANITADMPEGVAITVQTITERMRKQVEQAQQFAANIQALIAAGLDQAYIDQLVQAGVAGGGAEAAALVGATPEEIAALNELMQQLQGTGSTLGQQASDYLYGAGIREAQAFVDELEKQENKIERMMRRQARAFARELRDAMENLTRHHDGGKGHKGGKGDKDRVTVQRGTDQPLVSIGQINNPAPEPASVSVATRLRRLQQTGVLIETGAASA